MTAEVSAEDAVRKLMKKVTGWKRGDALNEMWVREITALLKSRESAAEMRALPPGTVAVCENYVYKQCADHNGPGTGFECPIKPCAKAAARRAK
jgi:hypothetical protein